MKTYTVENFIADLNEPYAWPGGYPRFFLTDDGEALSFDSAKENKDFIVQSITDSVNDGWRVIGCDVNWEDGSLYCADTGKRIESAYSEELTGAE